MPGLLPLLLQRQHRSLLKSQPHGWEAKGGSVYFNNMSVVGEVRPHPLLESPGRLSVMQDLYWGWELGGSRGAAVEDFLSTQP